MRAARAALALGFEVRGVSGQISGEPPVAVDGVEVVRVGRPVRINPLWLAGGTPRVEPRLARELRALFRVGRLLARAARMWHAARKLPAPTVVHAHDLDTLPAAYLLARRHHARLVYDAHELYSEFDEPAPRLARSLILALERTLARRADAVVTVSDGVGAELRRRLRLRVDPLVVVNAPPRADVATGGESAGPLRVVYQGGLGPGRGLDELLRAAEAEGVELTIRIRMAGADALRNAVAARGLAGRVRVAEPVPPDEVLDALAEFDVGLIFDRPRTRNAELSAPNKFYEYLMAGLAVVAPHLETLGPLIADEGIGATYPPGDDAALRALLEELAQDRPRVAALQERARALAHERLNAEAGAATLATAWGAA